jgi:hypothetical protein
MFVALTEDFCETRNFATFLHPEIVTFVSQRGSQQRHVQKLANAAQISFAERALLSGSISILVQNEQRSQSSPIDQISGPRQGEGDEL